MTTSSRAQFVNAYDERRLWNKIRRYGRAAGRELVEKALLPYFVLRDARTPAWARATVIAALGYFIAPLDAIPDVVPALGFTDDLATLALAAVAVASSVTPAMRERARRLADRLFGASAADGPVIEVEAEVLASERSRHRGAV